MQTSNRRFRDDEFLVPRDLTAGPLRHPHSRQVHARCRSRSFPAIPLPELAWSEMRYTAYSFVMPVLP